VNLPAWVPLSVVVRFTGLRKESVRVLVETGRLRTLKVPPTGKLQRYNKFDLGDLCGFQG
jgi:hypothetical protein